MMCGATCYYRAPPWTDGDQVRMLLLAGDPPVRGGKRHWASAAMAGICLRQASACAEVKHA